MNTTQIVDLIFDLHGEFISPKVIARRQVTRLIDRLLTRVSPELILNRQNEDKENASGNTAQETPAKAFADPIMSTKAPAAVEPSEPARKNLGLSLNQEKHSAQKSSDPMLE